MKILSMVIILICCGVVAAQNNLSKPPAKWTSNQIDREEHDSTRGAKRSTTVPGYKVYTTTINAGASLSDSVDLKDNRLAAIAMPSVWTVANLTFQVYASDGWRNLYYDDIEHIITAGSGYYVVVKPAVFAGIRYIKVRSGTSSTPVNQAGARVIYLVTRSY